MMKQLGIAMVGLLLIAMGPVQASIVNIYVDAAPNAYGSPDYAPWQAAAFAAVSAGTFVNMSNGINPANVGTTDFEIQDEVVYSFGDLGKRLTWIYWIPDTTIAELQAREFEMSLTNIWDGDVSDFYLDYYGSTWLEPTKWVEYNGGVIGTAGMAWWGAYGVNTQEALDADIAAWIQVDETWIFTCRMLDDTGALQEYSIECNREGIPAPEPASLCALLVLAGGVAAMKARKRR